MRLVNYNIKILKVFQFQILETYNVSEECQQILHYQRCRICAQALDVKNLVKVKCFQLLKNAMWTFI